MSEIIPALQPAQEVADDEDRGQIVMEGEQGGLLIRAAGMLLNQGSHLLASVDTHLAFLDSAPGRVMIAGLIGRTARNKYLEFKYSPAKLDELERQLDLEDQREVEYAGE